MARSILRAHVLRTMASLQRAPLRRWISSAGEVFLFYFYCTGCSRQHFVSRRRYDNDRSQFCILLFSAPDNGYASAPHLPAPHRLANRPSHSLKAAPGKLALTQPAAPGSLLALHLGGLAADVSIACGELDSISVDASWTPAAAPCPFTARPSPCRAAVPLSLFAQHPVLGTQRHGA